jgi:hypothetical protein
VSPLDSEILKCLDFSLNALRKRLSLKKKSTTFFHARISRCVLRSEARSTSEIRKVKKCTFLFDDVFFFDKWFLFYETFILRSGPLVLSCF